MIKVNKKYVFFLIASFIFALMEGGNLPYYIFYILLLVFLLGILHINILKSTLEVSPRFDKKIFFSGDNADALIVIGCESIANCIIVNVKAFANFDDDYNGEAVDITYNENYWIKKNISFQRRGIYNFGDINLRMKDIFGICEYSIEALSPYLVKVYPKIYEVKNMLSGGKDVFQHMTGINGGSEDLFSTRDVKKYTAGDNLKRVHWKLSAKYGELYVKNLDIISGEECYLFLNMCKENMLLDDKGVFEEELINFSASFIKCMLLNSIKSRVFINLSSSTTIDVETKQNFDGLMEFLLTHTSDGDNNFSDYINSNLKKLNSSNSIGIITLIIDDNLLSTIKQFKIDRKKVFVLYDKITAASDKITELKSYNVECYDIWEII